jgi:hypothetical protein
MCVVITVAMVMLLMDFGPYEIIFINVCCYNRCHGNAVNGFWALCCSRLPRANLISFNRFEY